MKRVQGPVVESLEEEEESKDVSTPKDGAEEPTRLTQRVDEKDTNEDSNRTGKIIRDVRTDTYKSTYLKLT